MNTKLLAAVSFLALATASHASENFNGWTLGASVGWDGSRVKFNNGFSGLAQVSNNPKYSQAIYAIHADWIQTEVNDMVYGLGFAIGYHSNSQTQTIINGATAGNGYAATSSVSLKQKRKFFTEVTARVGVNLGNAIVYGLASVKGTDTQYQFNANNGGTLTYNGNNILNGSNKVSYYSWGIAPGLGFDFKIDRDWSFGVEYRYFFETSKKALSDNITLKLNSHNLLARLSYHF